MPHLRICLMAVAGLLLQLVNVQLGASAKVPDNVRPPVKILPLGDSITFGTGSSDLGGYREPLLPMLHRFGFDVDFVGPQHSGTNAGDPDNAGYVGYLVAEACDKIIADQMIKTYKPDYIMLHIGTNNMGNDAMSSTAPSDLRNLISEIFEQGPKTRLILAAIIQTATAEYNNRIALYNQKVRDIAAELKQKGKPISFVDLSTTVITTEDLVDGIHPNDKGYKKMASAWLEGLKQVLPNAGAKIVQHNPHFQTLHSVPARTFEQGYIAMWESQGITIDFAESGTDLYAVNPLTGHDGIATTFNVTANNRVTVTFRVRESLITPSCPSAAHQLHVASDTGDKGLDIYTTSGDATWKIHRYVFVPRNSSARLSFRAVGPTPLVCGPSVADVLVRQECA